MAYTKTTFANGRAPPVQSEFLNELQDEIIRHTGDITGLRTDVENIDATVNKELEIIKKSHSGYTSIAGAGGTGTIAFSKLLNDDFGMISLSTYPTRITIPTGISKIKIKLTNAGSKGTRLESPFTYTINKNAIATSNILSFSGSVPSSSAPREYWMGSYESAIIDVVKGDYITISISGDAETTTLIAEVFVIK